MTISIQRPPNTRNVTVRFTYGPISAECTEDIGHLQYVADNLNHVIESYNLEQEELKHLEQSESE